MLRSAPRRIRLLGGSALDPLFADFAQTPAVLAFGRSKVKAWSGVGRERPVRSAVAGLAGQQCGVGESSRPSRSTTLAVMAEIHSRRKLRNRGTASGNECQDWHRLGERHSARTILASAFRSD